MFDSICHAFATTGTGGFSTRSASIAYYNSPAIEYIITLFMFLSGMNFTMLYSLFFRRKFKIFFTNSEIKAYIFITLAAAVGISVSLYFHSGYDVPTAIRQALFHVVSIETTTGFLSANIMGWMPITWIILSIVMFTGACAGSTSGGFKVVRIVALFKITINEFKYILHPRAVIPVRINNSTMNYSMEHTLLSFATLYMFFIIVGAIALCLTGVPTYGRNRHISYIYKQHRAGNRRGLRSIAFMDALYPETAKWISSLLMFIGRLEIFTVIILFVPRFWKDY